MHGAFGIITAGSAVFTLNYVPRLLLSAPEPLLSLNLMSHLLGRIGGGGSSANRFSSSFLTISRLKISFLTLIALLSSFFLTFSSIIAS